MSATLEQRLRRFRSRVAIRAWEYRQRHHAKGVWYRVRRALADVEQLFVISEQLSDELCREGFVPERCFLELQPPKTLVFVPSSRLKLASDARPIPVDMGADWQSARFLAAVPFSGSATTRRQFP